MTEGLQQAKRIKEPTDLGIKIGTPEEVFWTDVKKKCETLIEQCRHEVLIQKHILELAEDMIEIEKPKLKK